MRKVSLVTLLLTMSAGLAIAQVPKGNLFAGYSYARADISSFERNNLRGWNGSLEGKIFPFVGIVADVSGLYGSHESLGFNASNPGSLIHGDGRLLNAVGGPRVSFSVGKIRPFAEAMFGVSRLKVDYPTPFVTSFSGTSNSFAVLYGGGVDYHLLPLLSLRVEGDVLRTSFFDSTQNNFRLSTGIVLNF